VQCIYNVFLKALEELSGICKNLKQISTTIREEIISYRDNYTDKKKREKIKNLVKEIGICLILLFTV
jgi:hypothetical protein